LNFESQLSKSVFESKYLLENETHPDESVERLVKAVSRVYPEIEQEAREYISKQWFIPGGGIWRAAGNPNKNVSHVNCTTLAPVEDNLESIFESLYKWAKYAAFGQGEGIDISLLRPRGAKVHNSSRSSTGAVSFMHLYDAVLKVIAQQGRRGASLISIKDTHPDILEFIHVKDKPESDKSRIDTANISIQISDEFMKCVEEDKEWTLRFENKYEVIENKVRAVDVFNEICTMAHKRGDPGLQFIDTWKKNSNSDHFGYPLVSSNACGEIPNDSENICDLGHINLAKFHEYEWEGFEKLIRFGVYFLNAVRINEYNEHRSPIEAQRKKLKLMPRIGLGHTGFADYLIDNKIVYGSEDSVEALRKIHTTMVKVAFKASYDLAKKYGSFPGYSKEKMMKSGYIQRMLSEGVITEDLLDYQFNIQLFTLAPVGCLTKSSLIQTEDSIKSIEQIFLENDYDLNNFNNKENVWLVPKQNMYVKTMNGLKRIIRLYVNGYRKTLSLFNNNTKLIEGTENHMILVKKSNGIAIWKRLDEIKENDIIILKK